MSDSGGTLGDLPEEDPMTLVEVFSPAEKRLTELLQENIDLKLQLAARIAQDLELQQARETNRRLNRRCQAAESEFEASARQLAHRARYVIRAGQMLEMNLGLLRSHRREADRRLCEILEPHWVLLQRLEKERDGWLKDSIKQERRVQAAQGDFLAAKAAYIELEAECARLKCDAIYEPLYDAATAEVEALREAVRKHMNMRGDDRCHQDDHDLYAVLPEGDTRPAIETAVTIESCAKYIECRQQGCIYISPQRRIEELEAEVKRLKDREITELVDAIDAISARQFLILPESPLGQHIEKLRSRIRELET